MKHMTNITNGPRNRAWVFLAALVIGLACCGANAQVTILGVQYQQDNPYTQFQCIWHDSNYPTSCGSVVTGANVHVYLKNTGASSVTVSDVTLAGYSLASDIVMSSKGPSGGGYLSSIYFKWSSPPQDILNAGEPVWFKVDPGDTVPATLPAGGVAQAVVRLRHVPTTATVSVGVVTSGGTVTTNITIDANAPQLAGIGYSADLTKVYLNWRRSGGAAPASIWMDGVNVTAQATTVGDPSVNFGVSVVSLASPLTLMSYHVYPGRLCRRQGGLGLATGVGQQVHHRHLRQLQPDRELYGRGLGGGSDGPRRQQLPVEHRHGDGELPGHGQRGGGCPVPGFWRYH